MSAMEDIIKISTAIWTARADLKKQEAKLAKDRVKLKVMEQQLDTMIKKARGEL